MSFFDTFAAALFYRPKRINEYYMKKLTLITSLTLCLVFFGLELSAQEQSAERTTKYVFSLNAIKHQAQVDGVENQTKEIEHVQSCELNWLDYQMVVTVIEGGENGTFPMARLKTILQANRVELKNFKKEVIKQ